MTLPLPGQHKSLLMSFIPTSRWESTFTMVLDKVSEFKSLLFLFLHGLPLANLSENNSPKHE